MCAGKPGTSLPGIQDFSVGLRKTCHCIWTEGRTADVDITEVGSQVSERGDGRGRTDRGAIDIDAMMTLSMLRRWRRQKQGV